MINSAKILITGGTGSFGKAFLKEIIGKKSFERIVIYSRDELKQWELKQLYPDDKYPNLKFFIGDIRDPKFSDLRVLVSNHKVIASMERESESFLTNVYQGASYHRVQISSEIIKLSEKISRIFKLGYGGIDIKIIKKKKFVLEVNSIPSWRNINKLYKKDLSEKLVQDFIQIIKNFKKCQTN